jgi:hypothetical protein
VQLLTQHSSIGFQSYIEMFLALSWRKRTRIVLNPIFINQKSKNMKMQHLILAAGIVVFASCDTPSNTTSADYVTTNASTTVVVPATTQTAFVTRYPTATNVEWTMYNTTPIPIDWELTGWPVLDANDYAVRYSINNTPYYAWYDSDGNWIGSTYQVLDYTTLPAAVHSTLSSQYPGYTISDVDREDWNNMFAYEVEMKNADQKVKLVIDGNGKILKQKVKPNN